MLLSFAEVGADRGQLQAAARREQPVSGQPLSQDRGSERGGVRPSPLSAVEVLTQPAAVGAWRPMPSSRTSAQFGDHVLVMFLKLSAKLYTSVFHHGLKVGELQQGMGCVDCLLERRPAPSAQVQHALPGWHPLPRLPLPAGSAAEEQPVMSSGCGGATAQHMHAEDWRGWGCYPHSKDS